MHWHSGVQSNSDVCGKGTKENCEEDPNAEYAKFGNEPRGEDSGHCCRDVVVERCRGATLEDCNRGEDVKKDFCDLGCDPIACIHEIVEVATIIPDLTLTVPWIIAKWHDTVQSFS